jgi:phospholipid/cholesterol/gamma-HCH transport system substrate-binding protein
VRNSSLIGRIAAVTAVAIAVVAVAVIVLGGGSSYQVHAIFQNASQIVAGDEVQSAGNSIGTVSSITLTPRGEADLTLDINNKDYTPLRVGTIATVREASLTAVANRYVDLRLGSATNATIRDGGTIPAPDTNSEVDLDQLFNTFTPATRKALQNVIQGSAKAFHYRGNEAQQAYAYLNPAIASSAMLFRELNRDAPNFTNFVVKTGNLFGDIAQRQSDLTGLVQHLSQTTTALANQHTALGESIQRLPNFMRLADTTFTNLRSALNVLTPLVNDSKPVAPKLQKLLEQLKPLAENSVPTVRDLSNIVSRPGANNDLIELTKLGVPLAAATVNTIKADGKTRRGAFPISTLALNESTPELANFRPYSVDLTGWFEDYSHPGTIDANGSDNRAALVLGLESLESGQQLPIAPVLTLLQNLGLSKANGGLLHTGIGDRCPGSMERGALFYPESGYPCNPSETPTGP